jgi:hypothetical protein
MIEFLTPKQLADLLQVTEGTLANQRTEGRGIPFVKIEKAVRYRAVDLDEYMKNQLQGSNFGGVDIQGEQLNGI